MCNVSGCEAELMLQKMFEAWVKRVGDHPFGKDGSGRHKSIYTATKCNVCEGQWAMGVLPWLIERQERLRE